MKFTPQDRMLQLGIVPALSKTAKAAFPQASASLWQRDAKALHRRIVLDSPCAPGNGPCARGGRMVLSIAALLLAFHESAPENTDPSEEFFAHLVETALAVPVVPMLLAGRDPFSDTALCELGEMLLAGDRGDDPGLYAGTLHMAGDRPPVLSCTVERCGLATMCVRRKRFYLLKHLCSIECAQAACCGCDLALPPDRIATGHRRCRLLCHRA